FNSIIIDPLNALIDAISKLEVEILGKKVGIPDLPKIPRLETGIGSFQGGLALLGEMGPELAILPPGTEVLPAPRTQMVLPETVARNLNGGGSKPPVNLTLHFHGINGISQQELERIKVE